MARLKNVTEPQIGTLKDSVLDLCQDAGDYHNRIQQGYCDKLVTPLQHAVGLLSASRVLADLAHVILVKAQLEEMSSETERMLRSKVAKS